MKTLKKIFLIVSILIIISIIGGYFYFDKKFTPKENNLSIKGSTSIKFMWMSNDFSSISAMLIPIKLNSLDKTFYMQFDTGSPYTIFYKRALDTIKIPSSFSIGELNISSDNFRKINYGKPINWDIEKNIIGTIGTDLLEKRTISINYKTQTVTFNTAEIENGSKFTFEKRRILLPTKINNKKNNVIFDTGTSAFGFITRKDIFEKMILNKSSIEKKSGNSWGSTLSFFTGNTDTRIKCGKFSLKMKDVTYIEGYSTSQYLMMKLSGMGGMFGNKLFLDKTLIIDCKNQKFKID